MRRGDEAGEGCKEQGAKQRLRQEQGRGILSPQPARGRGSAPGAAQRSRGDRRDPAPGWGGEAAAAPSGGSPAGKEGGREGKAGRRREGGAAAQPFPAPGRSWHRSAGSSAIVRGGGGGGGGGRPVWCTWSGHSPARLGAAAAHHVLPGEEEHPADHGECPALPCPAVLLLRAGPGQALPRLHSAPVAGPGLARGPPVGDGDGDGDGALSAVNVIQAAWAGGSGGCSIFARQTKDGQADAVLPPWVQASRFYEPKKKSLSGPSSGFRSPKPFALSPFRGCVWLS